MEISNKFKELQHPEKKLDKRVVVGRFFVRPFLAVCTNIQEKISILVRLQTDVSSQYQVFLSSARTT